MLGYVCWGGLFGGYGVMEWGPEIAVNGVRPEWLRDDVQISFKYSSGGEFSILEDWFAPKITWEDKYAIRLPAEHPHYAQPSPADTVTVQVMSEDEAVQEFKTATHVTTGEHFLDGWKSACRHFGIIRPSRAERIAKSTNLSLADVERVLAAIEETE